MFPEVGMKSKLDWLQSGKYPKSLLPIDQNRTFHDFLNTISLKNWIYTMFFLFSLFRVELYFDPGLFERWKRFHRKLKSCIISEEKVFSDVRIPMHNKFIICVSIFGEKSVTILGSVTFWGFTTMTGYSI